MRPDSLSGLNLLMVGVAHGLPHADMREMRMRDEVWRRDKSSFYSSPKTFCTALRFFVFFNEFFKGYE